MKARRQWAQVLWSEQPGLHRGYVVDVASAIAMGLALILGGRERTVAPVWATLNESGGPVVWGWVFIALAVLLIAASFVSPPMMMAALWLGAILYGLLAWWFLDGALSEPTASFVGGVYSLRAAATHIFRGEAYRVGPGSFR